MIANQTHGEVYCYTVPGIPPSINQYLGRKNEWKYRAVKDEWTQRVAWSCKMSPVPLVPLEKSHVTITCFFKDNRRRDIDNVAKVLMDGLVAAKVIQDDCWQCVELHLRGDIDRNQPRVEIEIKQV